jgi:hypothetical protein
MSKRTETLAGSPISCFLFASRLHPVHRLHEVHSSHRNPPKRPRRLSETRILHEVQGHKLSKPQKPSSQSRAPPRSPPKWRRPHRLFPFDLHRRRPHWLFPFDLHRRRPQRIFQGPSPVEPPKG